jgi:hypothetical protein
MINLDYKFDDKYTGSTVRINADITDPDTGTTTDPTTISISIKDPDGALDVDGTAMTKDAVGDYHYDYTIPVNVGAFVGRTKLTSAAGKITIKTFGFWAEASL